MSAGWVLVQTSEDTAGSVAEALAAVPGVELAERTVGAYDVVARVADAGPQVRSAKRVMQAALRISGVTLAVCCHDGDGRTTPESVDVTDGALQPTS